MLETSSAFLASAGFCINVATISVGLAAFASALTKKSPPEIGGLA